MREIIRNIQAEAGWTDTTLLELIYDFFEQDYVDNSYLEEFLRSRLEQEKEEGE